MSEPSTHLCSFAGSLSELRRKDHGDPEAVLAALRASPRFSCFDIDSDRLARTFDGLVRAGRIRIDNSRSAYPWAYAIAVERGDGERPDHAEIAAAGSPGSPQARERGCMCLRCMEEAEADTDPIVPIRARRLVVCPICGNKRCPHSDDHRNECSGSNAPGQAGSRYGSAGPVHECTEDCGE